MFYGPDPAVLINNTLLVKGPGDKVLRLIREQDEEAKDKGTFIDVKNVGGDKFEIIELPHGDATILS